MTSTTAPTTNEPARCAASAATNAARERAEYASAVAALEGQVITGGETVILWTKPSMWRPILDSRFWLLGAFGTAGAISWMGVSLPGMSVQSSVQICLFVGLVRLAAAVMAWVPRWHLLTDHRVIDLRGIRTVQIDAWRLVDVRNTYQTRTASERCAGVGTITFVCTDPHQPPRVWRAIARPDEIHARIRRAIEQALDRQA